MYHFILGMERERETCGRRRVERRRHNSLPVAQAIHSLRLPPTHFSLTFLRLFPTTRPRYRQWIASLDRQRFVAKWSQVRFQPGPVCALFRKQREGGGDGRRATMRPSVLKWQWRRSDNPSFEANAEEGGSTHLVPPTWGPVFTCRVDGKGKDASEKVNYSICTLHSDDNYLLYWWSPLSKTTIWYSSYLVNQIVISEVKSTCFNNRSPRRRRRRKRDDTITSSITPCIICSYNNNLYLLWVCVFGREERKRSSGHHRAVVTTILFNPLSS